LLLLAVAEAGFTSHAHSTPKGAAIVMMSEVANCPQCGTPMQEIVAARVVPGVDKPLVDDTEEGVLLIQLDCPNCHYAEGRIR
jgi:hypothetical protein